MLDITSQNEKKICLAPVVVGDNTAAVGSIIDLANYDGCDFTVITGTLADADATFDVKLDEGAASNLSDAAEVTASDKLIGTVSDFTYADDSKCYSFGYRGIKRYVRVTVTPTGNSGSAPIAVIVSLRKKKVGSV